MQLNLIPYPRSVSVQEGFCEARTSEHILQPGMAAEEYRLSVTAEKITVTASDAQGILWGERTLAQLRRQFPDRLPCVEISDAPDYPIRAIHLDSSRHMLPIGELKRMAEAASFFKLNTIHWHISDDQGWRIESKAFPKLHEIGAYRQGDNFGTHRSERWEGGFYTRQEVKDFVSYCDCLGIQVIPEVDMPGHVTAILAAYPHLSCLGEPQQVVTRAAITTELLCAGSEEVFAFVEKMLDDLMELFPAKWFHIGGDEAPKVRWEHCPRCQARMRAEGLTSLRQLQGYMSNRIAAYLRSHGRRAILWNDGAYGGNIDADVVLQVWFPDQDGALQAHGDKGGQMIFSPVNPCYCDYPHGENSLSDIYRMVMEIPGVAGERILGCETLHWSEHIRTPQRLQELAWPRAVALAEAAWDGSHRGAYEDFLLRLRGIFPVFRDLGIHATQEPFWDPDPEEAQKQSKAFRQQFESESENQDYDLLLSQM